MSANQFDVKIEIRSHLGALLCVYYPLAGVLEFKRNRIFTQVPLAGLIEQGVIAKERSEGKRIYLPDPTPAQD